jgi:ribosome-binding factor A
MKKSRQGTRPQGPSQRQFRVGEEVRHALVRILDRAHFRDPDLAGRTITVTEVRISPDLRNATAFVTPLGGEERDQVVAALNRASGYFRRELAREVNLRRVPDIAFDPDTSFDYSNQIEAILQRPDVARDIAAPSEADDDGDDDDDGDAADGGEDGRGP